ncbi:hypothetical protein JV46_08860 [Solemya velum gill symbiont]|uniref:DUF2784 domain-containing protein n=1 Tax=Solemya velum gill symbiont TaxID=2340 RepID=A0A0B0HC13_SOVGS|nr:DUF2784 domain-containing protein [Solemya velum gill symbiont]KHF24971.1 hypothetical protein JV46_08860 [Solemya velum gill symbiont]
MLYSLAADSLLVVHFLFICFVLLGGLLLIKWRWMIFLHLPAATWGALVEFNSWICPLTPWEKQLRNAAGEASYETGCIEHYLMPLIYPTNLTYDMQIVLGSIVIIVNLLVYTWLGLRQTGIRDKGDGPGVG